METPLALVYYSVLLRRQRGQRAEKHAGRAMFRTLWYSGDAEKRDFQAEKAQLLIFQKRKTKTTTTTTKRTDFQKREYKTQKPLSSLSFVA